jgi:hypothetical protein
MIRRPYCILCAGRPAGFVRTRKVLEVTPGTLDDDGIFHEGDIEFEELEMGLVSFRCSRHRDVVVTDARWELGRDPWAPPFLYTPPDPAAVPPDEEARTDEHDV